MTKAAVPDDVRRFVLAKVPSVPFLEALLLLRSDTDTAWAARRLSQRLYVPEARAQELLLALADAGLARQEAAGGYRFAPEQAEAAVVDALALCYSRDLVGITDLIHSQVERRALQFADAFRWRKD